MTSSPATESALLGGQSPWKVIERLRARSTPNEKGCWIWDAGRTTDGYGKMKIGRHRTHRAHRLMWAARYGDIPAGKMVCHSCDDRACVNPDHLFLGTQSENIRDCVAKKRHFTPFRREA